MSSVAKDDFISALNYTYARLTYFCEFHSQQNGAGRMRKWCELIIIYIFYINSTTIYIDICNVRENDDNVYKFMTLVKESKLKIPYNCRILLEFYGIR